MKSKSKGSREEKNIQIVIPAVTFDTFDADYKAARAEAKKTGKVLYTWCTAGYSNWLDKGVNLADRMSFVLLPKNLPDHIDMADDEFDPDDDCADEHVYKKILARLHGAADELDDDDVDDIEYYEGDVEERDDVALADIIKVMFGNKKRIERLRKMLKNFP